MRDEDIPWSELQGGYKLPYDPRPALAALEAGTGSWHELWEELHHQGDVGTASYVAVPRIADIAETAVSPDWNPFSLAVTIEEARLETRNPPLPGWVVEDYRAAWVKLFGTAWRLLPDAEDEELLAALFAVLAMGKRLPFLARMAHLSERERGEMLEEVGWG